MLAQGLQRPAQASQRCWAPDQLTVRPGEKSIRRVPYDRAIEARNAALDRPAIPDGLRGSIRSVKVRNGQKLIALTFDLCENAGEISGYDGQIVDILRAHGVKATFFASGKWLIDHRERAQQLVADPLFQMGGHSWTHRNFRLLPPEDVKADLALDLKADAALRESLAAKACFRDAPAAESKLQQTSIFRFPFGTCSAEALKAVNDAGLLAIQWDVVSGDPAPAQSADAIRRGVIGSAKPGSIVVMHGNGRGWHTPEALPAIIKELRGRGFEFVTIGELLEKGEPVIASSCYELKPGDNARYDKLFPQARSAKSAPAAGATMSVPSPRATTY
jgi:peptidoglycan/xylan/chitin deacetylase (PgdA/CDA1 family)